MNGLMKTVAVAATGLFAMTAPLAAGTITFGDLNTTVGDGESQSFDMNGDGLLDLSFSLTEDGNASVEGLFSTNGGVDQLGTLESFTTVQTIGGSSTVELFGANDVIGMDRADRIAAMGGPRMVSDIGMIDGFADDLAMWPTSGDTGYMAWTTSVLDVDFDRVDTYYGYLFVERGSIVLGQYAVSTGALTIPSQFAAVPLPAGLPLLLAGLGAFGIAKRRKARAA